MAIVVTGTDNSSLNLQANNGAGGNNGGAGTISLKTTGGTNYNLSIGDLTTVPQSGTGVVGSSLTFSTVTLNNSIVVFDTGSTVNINSLIVGGGATVTGNNFIFGSDVPLTFKPGSSLGITGNQLMFPTGLTVQAGGSLQITANLLTVPSGPPIEVQAGSSLAWAVSTRTGGVLHVGRGGTFRQFNAQLINFDSVSPTGGVLTHAANANTRKAVLNLNVRATSTYSGRFDFAQRHGRIPFRRLRPGAAATTTGERAAAAGTAAAAAMAARRRRGGQRRRDQPGRPRLGRGGGFPVGYQTGGNAAGRDLSVGGPCAGAITANPDGTLDNARNWAAAEGRAVPST